MFSFFLNIFVFVAGILFVRSKKYVLVGSWMGQKFADNSRYLYDYLFYNKKEAKIKKVIWATRSDKVFCELKNNGFDVVKIGTLSSFFYHCKSGVHIICNTFVKSNRYAPDIDTRFSSGAKKVQLWHGNGIKRVFGRETSRNRFVIFLKTITIPGLWHPSKMFFLCKSNIDIVFFKDKFGVTSSRCIYSNYPRTDILSFKTAEEVALLDKIKSYKTVILFLPTFREDYSFFVHPLSNPTIFNYLNNNSILWIEKPHSADDKNKSIINSHGDSILLLNDSFDINLLIPVCNILITDYSSAMLDALFFRKQIIYYTPDFDNYVKNDRGFLVDYDSVTISKRICNVECLVESIKRATCIHGYNQNSEKIRELFWENDKLKNKDIWLDIKRKIS